MVHDLEVRSAARDDRDAILHLLRQAFTADGRDGREELDIVESIWRLDAACDDLELVATAEGIVFGYVLGSWGDLEGRPVVGIAPLAVTPAFQRLGVGTALMQELIERADRARLPLLVLLGSPDYYGRFGFESSVSLDVHYRPVGPQSPYFLVRRLRTYTAVFCGAYRYAWETGEGY
jgi:putative acetyltransferase